MNKHTIEQGGQGGDERRSSASFEEFEDEVTQNIRVPPMLARGTMKRAAEPAPTPDEIAAANRSCTG